MSKPSVYRCPRCRAKMKNDFFAISCKRCGYSIPQPLDNLTERFWGFR